MQRSSWLVLVLSASACSKQAETPKKNEAPPPPPVVADAAPSADAAFDNDVEPTAPPPAPTLSKGRGDCKLEYAPRPTRDPNMMCKVPGGTFMMGTDNPRFKKAQPAHPVRVKSFRIDRYEIAAEQVAFYLNVVRTNDCPSAKDGMCFYIGGDPALIEVKDGTYKAVAGSERLPMTWASIEGAERYCAWAGKRLPSEAEWEYAARHDPKTGKELAYPWGDRFEANRANCLDGDGFVRLAPIGSFDGTNGRQDGTSPWGVHDMAGNASELTSSCFKPYERCPDVCEDTAAAKRECERVERTSSLSAPEEFAVTYARAISVGHAGFRCAISE